MRRRGERERGPERRHHLHPTGSPCSAERTSPERDGLGRTLLREHAGSSSDPGLDKQRPDQR